MMLVMVLIVVLIRADGVALLVQLVLVMRLTVEVLDPA